MKAVDSWIGGGASDLIPGIIAAAIVHQNYLEWVRVRLQSLENPLDQR